MKLNHGIRTSFAGIFVCLYLFSFLANSVFLHTHYLPDGEVVTHSHPYKSPKHAHSDAEFHFLPQGQLAVIVPAAFAFVAVFSLLGRIVCRYQEVRLENIAANLFLRGPPAYIFS